MAGRGGWRPRRPQRSRGSLCCSIWTSCHGGDVLQALSIARFRGRLHPSSFVTAAQDLSTFFDACDYHSNIERMDMLALAETPCQRRANCVRHSLLDTVYAV